MCGITGQYRSEGVEANAFYLAHNRLAHRGPDDEGVIYFRDNMKSPIVCSGDRTVAQLGSYPHASYINSVVGAMGHHRLSVLDVSEKGHQPMCFDGLWIVFNGEIYNFKELKVILSSKGYSFEDKITFNSLKL